MFSAEIPILEKVHFLSQTNAGLPTPTYCCKFHQGLKEQTCLLLLD